MYIHIFIFIDANFGELYGPLKLMFEVSLGKRIFPDDL